MISQDPFIEIREKTNRINERTMNEVYGISLSDFLSLPNEFQDVLMLHYWQTLRKAKKEQKHINQDEIIKEKKKILSIFKKNK